MIIVYALILAAVLYFISAPLFQESSDSDLVLKDKQDELTISHHSLLKAYQEIELDRATGKLSEDEFSNQKATLMAELKVVYKELDARNSSR